MSDSCLVCGASYRRSKIPSLLTCGNCAFTTADLRVSPEELKNLYGANYFAGDEYRDYIADRPVIERQSRSRLKTLLTHVDGPGRKHLLEIGCAYGFFLTVARTRFGSVQGIDISESAATFARDELRLNVASGDFMSMETPKETSVICMWDTIEHLDRPGEYIRKASDLLPVGGTLAVTTGDLGSAIARWRGAKWRQIHPPTHLQYFSRETLRRLLEKNNFRIRYMGTEGVYRSVDSMAYIILCLKQNRRRFYSFLRASKLLDWHLYLNLGDIMLVIAEKTA